MLSTVTVILIHLINQTVKKRCQWAKDEPNTTYHDTEWGIPQHDDQKLFEFLILEGAQAGISWTTVLKRRDGYRDAFSNFDAKRVSKFTQKHVEKLLHDESIIRNKLKICSASRRSSPAAPCGRRP